MFALAASVQELVLFLQKHLKIDVVSYSASVGSSRPMFSLSEIVHRIHCRCFDCVAEFSSNPGCRSHRPSYFRTPVIVVIGSRLRLGRTKPFPVPKQLLLLGHLDVERECSRRVPTSSADGAWRLAVSPVAYVTSSSTFVVGLTCTSCLETSLLLICARSPILRSELVKEWFSELNLK